MHTVRCETVQVMVHGTTRSCDTSQRINHKSEYAQVLCHMNVRRFWGIASHSYCMLASAALSSLKAN